MQRAQPEALAIFSGEEEQSRKAAKDVSAAFPMGGGKSANIDKDVSAAFPMGVGKSANFGNRDVVLATLPISTLGGSKSNAVRGIPSKGDSKPSVDPNEVVMCIL